MKRPNRYPYTKDKRKESVDTVYFGDGSCVKVRAEQIRITSEVKQ